MDKGDPIGSLELSELEASQIQLSGEFRARKCKENQGKFLGFLWSNRDFSMGYDESK
jgi:hypothetical protein